MNRVQFFNAVRGSLFSGTLGQEQVDGMDTILTTCEQNGLNAPATAYVLATAYHETGRRMMPVREAFGRSDAETYHKVSTWLKRSGRRNYAAIDRETGQSFYGRGYVQLTHRENYARAGDKLGHDFEHNPDDVMRPHFAAQILVRGMVEGWFTGKKLADYHLPEQFREARRIVNALDKADTIAGHAEKFRMALA